jgi:hypothetical protein
MLAFPQRGKRYINRAGANLTAERRKTLEAAKDELRNASGREGDG